MKPRISLNRPDTSPKVRKQAWERDRDHRAFVRSLPCAKCGRSGPCDAAHVRNGTDGAAARQPSDRYCVPLCRIPGNWGCHDNQHLKGEITFWSEVEGDPLDLAAKLWSLSRKYEGDELVERGRYAVKMWRER